MLGGMADEDGERAELVSGLTGPGQADLACRLALNGGATSSVSPARVSVAELVTIYRRRVHGMQNRGVTTIESDTAVARLEAFHRRRYGALEYGLFCRLHLRGVP